MFVLINFAKCQFLYALLIKFHIWKKKEAAEAKTQVLDNAAPAH